MWGYVVGGIVAVATGCIFWLRRRKSKYEWGYFDYKSYPDLSGKTIVITGANDGLGYETAKILASKKAKVVLACRNPVTGIHAAAQIRSETKNEDVSFMQVDLGSFNSIKAFAFAANEKFKSIDVLVCNAGVWVPMEKKQRTADGFEIHFGVNHLGHFLLSKLLLEKSLKNSKDGRIVVVSSNLMMHGKLDMIKQDFVHEGRAQNPGGKSFAPAGYCDTKLMNTLYCYKLSKELETQAPQITTYSCCPGFCYTNLSKNIDIPWYKKILFAPFMMAVMRSAWRGSHNIVRLVLEDKKLLKSGYMYKECKVGEKQMELVKSLEEETEKLWTLSENLIRNN